MEPTDKDISINSKLDSDNETVKVRKTFVQQIFNFHLQQEEVVSNDSLATNTLTPKAKRHKTVKKACFGCKRSHSRCSKEWPCQACVNRGTPELCYEVPRKKRTDKGKNKSRTFGLS